MVDSSRRICHSCNRDNLPDATICVYCGAALGSTTVIVPDKPIGVTRTNYLSQIIRLHDDALILLIATQDQPIVLKGDGKFLIGRNVENEAPPTLDMTKYGGHMLGVSRRHASIQRTAEGYVIEDLASANGSFVNEKRLQPNQPYSLRNGDLIRLGQLILFAYFSTFREKRPSQLSEHTFWLMEKSEQKIAPKLTLQQLMSQVLPYLNAIAALQNIIDDLLKRPIAEMEINQIVVEKNSNSIKVAVVSYNDAIQLIQGKLNPLRQKSAESSPPTPASDSTPSSELPPVENASTTLRVESASDLHKEMFASHRALATEFLLQVAPSLEDDKRVSYVERLLVPLYTLTASRFELTTQPQ